LSNSDDSAAAEDIYLRNAAGSFKEENEKVRLSSLSQVGGFRERKKEEGKLSQLVIVDIEGFNGCCCCC
jgi:hypothetical protein